MTRNNSDTNASMLARLQQLKRQQQMINEQLDEIEVGAIKFVCEDEGDPASSAPLGLFSRGSTLAFWTQNQLMHNAVSKRRRR